MALKKELTFPHLLKTKYGEVKIYRCVNREEWITHVVAWRQNGKRVRESHSEIGDALDRAEQILEDFKQGRVERSETPTGKFLYYRACEDKLGGSVRLMDAVDFYLAHHPSSKTAISVAAAIEEFLKAKTESVSEDETDQHTRHLNTLKYRLAPFKKAFTGSLASITPKSINEYLARIDGSGRTKFNHRSTLISFFKWAQSHSMLPNHEPTAAQRSEEPKFVRGEPGIFTPEDFERLLTNADDTILPFLAIAGLAGVRTAELERLTWANVKWDESVIVLKKTVGKGARRRAAKIRPNLMTWLAPFKERTGKILTAKRPHDSISALAKKLNLKWEHNGLRHSYISYAMALERNASVVAEQCGNSEGEIQRSYKALVTETAAKKWFSLERI